MQEKSVDEQINELIAKYPDLQVFIEGRRLEDLSEDDKAYFLEDLREVLAMADERL